MLRKLISAVLVSPESPLFPLAARFAWTIPVVAILVSLAGALEGLSIGLLMPLLETLGGSGSASGLGFLAGVGDWFPAEYRLVGLSLLILVGIVLKGVLGIACAVFVHWVDGQASHAIRTQLAERLVNVGYPFLLRADSIRLLNIISTESWRASDAIQLMFRAISSAVTIAVFLLFVGLVQWQLFVVALVGVLLIRLLQTLATRNVNVIGAKVSAANLGLGDRMIALCLGIPRLVRLFGREREEQERFDAASNDVRRTMLDASIATSMVGPAFEVLYALLFLGIFIVAHWLGVALSTLIVFLLLMYRMQPHIRDLSTAGVEIATRRSSIAEVEWLLDASRAEPLPGGTAPYPGLRDRISFEQVSFGYDVSSDRDAALREVSFAIRANRSTALVGRSGSGKSTIVNLLARLIEPTGGRISIDGVPLSTIEPTAMRARVAIAGQDAELFNGTIAENIRYGTPEASEAEIVDAAMRADAHGFISALPLGYATELQGPGFGLSGGQRQRIGLARALLRDPDVLILDEATSAVDVVSERAIMDLVSNRRPGQTLIVISHRESTVAYCEDCIVLEAGAVLEARPTDEISPKLVREAIEEIGAALSEAEASVDRL